MTTYYGVWSDSEGEWWFIGRDVFYVTMLGVARAQARVANAIWGYKTGLPPERQDWEARVIGEDGLPTEETPSMSDLKAKCEVLEPDVHTEDGGETWAKR